MAVPVLTVGIAAPASCPTGAVLGRGWSSRDAWPLSNYLVRSAVWRTGFYSYGFGLVGRVAAATGVGLSVASFTVQLIVCRWWSDQIGAGPVERVLRWMTYGHRP